MQNGNISVSVGFKTSTFRVYAEANIECFVEGITDSIKQPKPQLPPRALCMLCWALQRSSFPLPAPMPAPPQVRKSRLLYWYLRQKIDT